MTNARKRILNMNARLMTDDQTFGPSRVLLWVSIACTLSLSLAAALPLSAQTFTTLGRFNGTNGAGPYAVPAQGPNGQLYGATGYGGANDQGAVYELTPQGLTLLHTFSELEAAQPFASFLLTSSGNFYSTTFEGGPLPGPGTIFQMTPAGDVTVLYYFCALTNCVDGANPNAALLLATDGNFYGTAVTAGANGDWGAIFRMTPTGDVTTIYSFCSQANCTDGSFPYGPLVQGTDGNFYGTTGGGGANNRGSVFEITASATLTTLYSFCALANCSDGSTPFNGLVQSVNGNFYGTTYIGGSKNNGTIFRLTPTGVLTVLHSFCSQPNCTDGALPNDALWLATDGNLYGTSYQGGAHNAGVIFKISPAGAFSVIHHFCSQRNCFDGSFPIAGVMQATNGSFYGTATSGGFGSGTIYQLSVGLPPFVQTVPSFGRAGTQIIILGNGLSSVTALSFNGSPASFSVVSDTEIAVTVPTGATTGPVKVRTVGGTLKSSTLFQVLP
jgi:uncharacterized repeat protein (TIGR03803 family)